MEVIVYDQRINPTVTEREDYKEHLGKFLANLVLGF